MKSGNGLNIYFSNKLLMMLLHIAFSDNQSDLCFTVGLQDKNFSLFNIFKILLHTVNDVTHLHGHVELFPGKISSYYQIGRDILSINKPLHTLYTGLPVFLTEAKMNLFETTENPDCMGRNLPNECYFIQCYTVSLQN